MRRLICSVDLYRPVTDGAKVPVILSLAPDERRATNTIDIEASSLTVPLSTARGAR